MSPLRRKRAAPPPTGTLSTSDEINRRILEAVSAGVVLVARDGAILQANPFAERILGLGYDRLLGMYVADFEHKTITEDGEELATRDLPVSRCLETGEPQPPMTVGVRRADGAVSWGIYSALPVHDAATHAVSGAVVTFVDVTEQKRAEDARRENAEMVAALLKASPVSITALDLEGRVLTWNPAAERIFGWKQEEVRGQTLPVVPPNRKPEFEDLLRRIAAGEPVVDVEVRRQRKDGSLVDLTMSAAPVRDSAGRARILVAVAVDITERKRAEAERSLRSHQLQVLSQKLVEVQEGERRHLARELHDEIGQLLTGLKYSIDTALRQVDGAPKTTLHEVDQTLSRLIARVRNLSLDLRPPMLDDLGLGATLAWHCQRYEKQTGIRVEIDHDGLGEMRFASPIETAAYRIVQEALTNVARHAATDAVFVRVRLGAGRLTVEIRDQGGGFRVTGSEALLSGGLSGMRERARLLGGRLRVESRPGEGTVVTAELPATELMEETLGLAR